jgi:hypothetical protein
MSTDLRPETAEEEVEPKRPSREIWHNELDLPRARPSGRSFFVALITYGYAIRGRQPD